MTPLCECQSCGETMRNDYHHNYDPSTTIRDFYARLSSRCDSLVEKAHRKSIKGIQLLKEHCCFMQSLQLLRPHLVCRWIILTPAKSPLFWAIINLSVVAYSIYLLILVWNSDDGRKQLRKADQSYLIYDFTTTILWVVETLLGVAVTVVYQDHNTATDAISGTTKRRAVFSKSASILHCVVALVFLVDSTQTLHKWKWQKEDIVVDAVWVTMDLLAYSFALAETAVHFWFLRDHSSPSFLLVDADELQQSIHHDPLLGAVLPHYDSIQRVAVEKRPSYRVLQWKDFTQLVRALEP